MDENQYIDEDGFIHVYDPETGQDSIIGHEDDGIEDEEGGDDNDFDDEERTREPSENEEGAQEDEPEDEEPEGPENPEGPEGPEGSEMPEGAGEGLGEGAAEGAGEAAGEAAAEAGAEAAAEVGAEALGTEVAAGGGAAAGGSFLLWIGVALLVILGICLLIWFIFIIWNAVSPSAGSASGSNFSCAANSYAFPFVNKEVPTIPKSHHNYSAIDLMAKDGQPLVAVTNGKVIMSHSTDSSKGGIGLTILGDDGYTYYYAHLEYLDPTIKSGKVVKAGDPVGRSGHTGNATASAPHLHFGISKPPHRTKGYFPYQLDHDQAARQESPWRTLEAWKKGECIVPGT